LLAQTLLRRMRLAEGASGSPSDLA
jgi:hypothetical protein